MTAAEEWERLAQLIEDDVAVAEAVRDAVEHGDDPWEVLLDALDEVGALAYLRADDTGMELADALAQLPRVFALQPNLDDVADTNRLLEAIRSADARLAAGRLQLLRLVEADDEESWPLVVVPSAEVGEIRDLVARLGHQVHEWARAAGR